MVKRNVSDGTAEVEEKRKGSEERERKRRINVLERESVLERGVREEKE